MLLQVPPPLRSDARVAIHKDKLAHYCVALSSSSSSLTPSSSLCSSNRTISSAANLVPLHGSNPRSLLALYNPESGVPSRDCRVYELRSRLAIRCGTDHMGVSFLMEAKVCVHSVAWICTRLPGSNITFFGARCSNFLLNFSFRFAA